MALSPDQKQLRLKELRIGKQAARLATQYLHKNIDRTFDVKNRGGLFKGREIKPMLESTRVKAKIGEHVLLGLDGTSNRYAFIHHFGFQGKRDTVFIRFTHSRFLVEFTERSSHSLDLKEQSIFTDLYAKSGALSYLAERLAETRSQAFQLKFNDIITKLSSDEQ